jgi:DNA-binding NarL/FixJ family response regulator
MKFLIVDDHPVLREGLSALLGQTFAPSTVVLACDAGEAFAALSAHDNLDVVILDLNMPGMAGMDVISEIGRRRAELPIIVLSSSEDARDVRKAIALGALGYVSKSANQQTLTAAIRFVLDGNVYVPPFLLNEQGRSADVKDNPADDVLRLTPRQVEILVLLSRGESNRLIAQTLDLAEKTVKVHITTIFKILNVVNRTQAAAVGRAAGLI